MTNGWERLGSWVAGGGRRGAENAYRERLSDNIMLGTRDHGLQQAAMRTDARRTGIRKAAIANGYSEAEADLIAANAQGESGSDYAATVRGLGDTAVQGYRRGIVDAPDIETANRYAMAVDGKPVALSRIVDGTAYNPTVAPSLGSMVTTDVGQSRIDRARSQTAADRALAAQRQASGNAASRRASIAEQQFAAQQAGRWNPSGKPGLPMPAPATAAPKRIATKAEFDALPRGAMFIAPDGSVRRKP